MKTQILLFFFSLLFYTPFSFAVNALNEDVPQIEYNVLVELYQSTGGDNWLQNDKWLSDAPVAEWQGVTVGDGRVFILDLSKNQLTGTLPSSLCNLTHLSRLYLMNNQLTGPIPACLGELVELNILQLYDNQFSGAVPVELCQLKQLITLGLGRNQLNSNLPECIGTDLQNLQILYLSHNTLSGQIPTSFAQLTQLEQLYLDNNQLTGPLPADFIGMALASDALIQLHISGNHFDLAACQSVKKLAMRGHWVDNIVGWPTGGFVHSPQAAVADFEAQCPPLNPSLTISKSANATAHVTDDLGQIDCGETCTGTYAPNAMVTLTAATNDGSDFLLWSGDCYGTESATTVEMNAHKTCTAYFESSVSFHCTDLEDPNECDALIAFYYATGGESWTQNKKAGWLEADVADDWYGVTVENGHVTKLALAGANLSGKIPETICQLTQLQQLELGTYTNGNQLIGDIPACLGDLTALHILNLASNQLTGQIPSTLGQLGQLTQLDLRDNLVEGEIPGTLCDLANLESLMLGAYEDTKGNLLGEIPACIGEKLVNLTNLILYYAAFSGEIPTSFCNLDKLQTLNIGYNALTGEIPACLGNLTNLQSLNLHINQLDSEIPSSFDNLVNLTNLQLDRNKLTGAIPNALCQLSQLETLNLFQNQFTGAIPSCLENLPNLKELWLYNNGLTGQIPNAICQLTHLTTLYLGANPLEGEIPDCIGDLSSLQRLFLGQTNISGHIPNSFSNLTNLEALALHENGLSGSPPEAFVNAILGNANLKQLNISKNNFNVDACQAVHKIKTRGGWSSDTDTWGWWWFPNGLDHSPQNDNFDFDVDCASLDFYILNVVKTGNGKIEGDNINCGHQCIEAYDINTPITLTATAKPGVTFTGWGGDCTGSEPTVNINLDADKTCTADFETIPICEEIVADIPQNECQALVTLFQDTQGDQWQIQQGWLADPLADNWHGVTVAEGHVVALQLEANGLEGTLPVELCDLAELTQLSLGLNQLSGPVPNCLGNLTQLQLLYLSQNGLMTGELPSTLGNLTQLAQLYLDGNEFEGPLPNALVNMLLSNTNLVQLNLHKNNFGVTECKTINDLIKRGGWVNSLPNWEDVSNGLMHSPQNDGFDFNNDCIVAAVSQLTVTKIGEGKVTGSGIDCGFTCVKFYDINTPVTLTAEPAPGFTFSHWSNSCLGQTANPLDLLMDSTKVCTANFAVIPPTLCEQVTDISQTECEALSTFYEDTGGADWTTQTGWLEDETVGAWFGVTVEAGHVTALELADNNLGGMLTPALCQLEQLQTLKLGDNPDLTGDIPTCIGDNLLQLQTVAIPNDLFNEANGLTGDIPSTLCNLTELQTLFLQGNQLTGDIPSCLGDLSQLMQLGLHHNNLTGSVPAALCQLEPLNYLGLGRNQLTGTIPTCIGNDLLQLEVLYLSNNTFTGPIPTSLQQLTHLKQLYLNDNQLAGPFDQALVDKLLSNVNLIQLNVQQNNLGIDDCAAIQALIAVDRWVAEVPDWQGISDGFMHSPQADGFDFNEDCFTATLNTLTINKTGSGTGTVISSDENINCGGDCEQTYDTVTSLQLTAQPDADATFGGWSGHCESDGATVEVLVDADKTCTADFILALSSGDFCDEITSVSKIECEALLSLYTALQGENWPHQEGWLTDLDVAQWYGVTVTDNHVTALALAANNLTGSLPPAIGDLLNLTTLMLFENAFTGELPTTFCQLTQLTQLDLSSNQFNGKIPACIGGAFLNLQQLSLANNQFNDQIPKALGDLDELQQLYLANNDLESPIPGELVTMILADNSPLTRLTLDNNYFNADECGVMAQMIERGNWLEFSHSPQKNSMNFNECIAIDTSILLVGKAGAGNVIGEGIDCGGDCIHIVAFGEVIDLEAVPETGAIFTHWSGDCGGTTAQITVTMDSAEKGCTAHFEAQQPADTLKVTKTGYGTVKGKLSTASEWSLTCADDCIEVSYNYPPDSQVTLQATPARGFSFKGWGADCQHSTETQITVVINRLLQTCQAEFTPVPEALSLAMTTIGPGIISSNQFDCEEVCTAYYLPDSITRLTAVADENALFMGWEGDCQGVKEKFTLPMDTNKTCTARFEPHDPNNIFTLTLSKEGKGRGTLRATTQNCWANCLEITQAHPSGEQVTVRAQPAENFIFSHWEGHCDGTEPTVTLIMNEDKNCIAHFDLDPSIPMHTLTINIVGTGKGSVKTSQWIGATETCQTGCTIYYPSEQSLWLNAVAQPFSTAAGWSGDCTGGGRSIHLVMTQDMTCTANFQSDFEVSAEDIIAVFYAKAQLKTGGLAATYPREDNEACLRQAFWLSMLPLMQADQHLQLTQTWPTQLHDIDWYQPMPAESCVRSLKTTSAQYIAMQVKLKTTTATEELVTLVIYYDAQPIFPDSEPAIFFARKDFLTTW